MIAVLFEIFEAFFFTQVYQIVLRISRTVRFLKQKRKRVIIFYAVQFQIHSKSLINFRPSGLFRTRACQAWNAGTINKRSNWCARKTYTFSRRWQLERNCFFTWCEAYTIEENQSGTLYVKLPLGTL